MAKTTPSNVKQLGNVCGTCGGSFATEDEYSRHVCKTTGYAPVHPEHLGEGFAAVSAAALQRGAGRKQKG